MTLILTSVIPATDTKGTRIKATSTHYGTSATIPMDHAFGLVERHAQAVRALCRKMNKDESAQFRGELDRIALIGDAPHGKSGRWNGYAFDARSSMSSSQVWDV